MVQSAFVISDIHLGATTSLLTAIDVDAETDQILLRPLAEAVLDKLLADLKAMLLGEKVDQCILLGDIFEFSFASYGLAMKNGRWFFQKLVDSNLFEEFVYVPGNHDHHLWQQISEDYYLLTELDNPPLNYPKTLPANFVLENTFLDRLMPEGYGFKVTYPNYEIAVNDNLIFFHHGHFLQKLYIAASKFLSDTIHTQNIEDLESLNAPFLEFGWYNIGQAYNIGKHKLVDKLYAMYKNNNTQQVDRLLKLFLKKIDRWEPSRRRRRWNVLGMMTDSLIKLIGPYILKRLFFKHSQIFSKHQHASSARHKRLSTGSEKAVMEYVSKYLLHPHHGKSECTFIFGHTHEPEINYLCEDESHVCYHIYNTGGWVTDSVTEEGELILPKATPIYIAPDGSVNPLPFSETNEAFLRDEMAKDQRFQEIKTTHALEPLEEGDD